MTFIHARHRWVLCSVGLAGLASVCTSVAQTTAEAASPSGSTVAPRVFLSETITDNAGASSLNKKGEQVTEVGAGVRINLNRSRVKTLFDFGLTSVNYAQQTSANRTQRSLASNGSVEAIDNFFFVDFGGSISQQTVSAFGVQSLDNSVFNPNRTEVAAYQISPRWVGQLGSFADYSLRISRSVSSSDFSGSSSLTSTAGFSSKSVSRGLGWTADMSRQDVSFSGGRPTQSNTANAGLTYRASPELLLSSVVGRESNNFTGQEQSSGRTTGYRLSWSPSEVTSVTAGWNRRIFGSSHALSMEYRSARTVWRFSDTRDVSEFSSGAPFGSLGSNYDLFFKQFEAVEPDPTARALLVDAYLANNGLSPTAKVAVGLQTAALALQRRQDASVALLGVRDTITLGLSHSESTRLDTVSQATDDLLGAGVVTQSSVNLQLAHRLTPEHSLTVFYSASRSGASSTGINSTLKGATVALTGRLSPKSSGSVSVRRTSSSNSSAQFTENVLSGNINYQF